MSKDDFFSKLSINKSTVNVDGFGDVDCHELKLIDRLNVRELPKGDLNVAMATVISMGCPMFSEEDIPRLIETRQDVLLLLFREILKLSGMQEGEEKKP